MYIHHGREKDEEELLVDESCLFLLFFSLILLYLNVCIDTVHNYNQGQMGRRRKRKKNLVALFKGKELVENGEFAFETRRNQLKILYD